MNKNKTFTMLKLKLLVAKADLCVKASNLVAKLHGKIVRTSVDTVQKELKLLEELNLIVPDSLRQDIDNFTKEFGA